MNCPDCGTKIGASAFRCRCGWTVTKGEAITPRAECAVSGCGALTMIREKTPTGWANFCEHHYVAYHHKRSADRVKNELGLKTVEEMKEFCRKRVKGILKPIETVAHEREQRQPAEVDF